ncbi:MAG: glycosyltransferase family 2 protein [Nitrososphaerota archaeon]|nr:glycosyltransferase family 2 protein [Candidatus Bathyarchaeota archaeon]MDW8048384.1 glycosyltransferase family 2 protein [Nitrososphaerota archaeon]
MSNLSIFIPVYKESELLEQLLNTLLSDPFEDKEIFVIIDEPTPNSLGLEKKFSSKVTFIWNGKRKGKANALNEVIGKSSGEILLFLDSDVMIKNNSNGFLSRIYAETSKADIVEVKKFVIRDSILSRIVNYDYLGFNFTSWFLSKKLGKCLGLNGAAFAIRRETFIKLGGFRKVILEDLDIGIRSFREGLAYKFLDDIEIYTRAPPSWRQWFEQRKRWGIGGALWLRENLGYLLKIVKQHPSVVLPPLFFMFPFLPFFLFILFTPDELYVKTIYLALIFFSTQTSILLPPTAFTASSLALLKCFIPLVGSIGVYSSLFGWITRKMNTAFHPVEFAAFYLIYSPIWLLIIVVSIVKVYAKIGETRIDWKVDN